MAVAERRFRVMASDAHVITVDANPEATDRAVRLLDRLEQRWSRFQSASDVTALNHAGGATVEVDPTTITLLETMREAWHLTGRGFDPTVLRSLLAAGYTSSIVDAAVTTSLPDVRHSAATRPPTTVDDVVIDRERGTVSLPDGLSIDPGGIGKGLAADLAAAQLIADGATGALVSIGGDLTAVGTPPTPGWTIEVGHPDGAGSAVCMLSVDAGGVATSSTRSRRWVRDDEETHHLIDPGTGLPSNTDLATVTVVARSGWMAEAHATAATLRGADGVLDYLDRHDVSGMALASDGRVIATDDLLDALGPWTVPA